MNASLEPSLVRYLQQHSRANYEHDEDSDDGFGMGGGTNPMEAMFFSYKIFLQLKKRF